MKGAENAYPPSGRSLTKDKQASSILTRLRRNSDPPAAEEGQEWARHDGRDQRHENEHTEGTLRQNMKLVSEIQSDEFHQTASIH